MVQARGFVFGGALGFSLSLACGGDDLPSDSGDTSGSMTATTTAATTAGSDSGPLVTTTSGSASEDGSSAAPDDTTTTAGPRGDTTTGGESAFNAFSGSFDGVDGEMTVGPVADVLGPEFAAVTISAWLRRNDAEPASQGVLTLGDGTFADAVFLLWSSEGEEPSIAFYAGGIGIRAPVADPTVWVHVVATYDAQAATDNVRLYLDGQPIVAGDATLEHVSSGDFFVGRFGPTGLWLDGSIDELAIWSVALGPAEVEALSGGVTDLGMPLDAYVSTDALLAWWRMGDTEGGRGTAVVDEVGGAPGQLVAGATFSQDVP